MVCLFGAAEIEFKVEKRRLYTSTTRLKWQWRGTRSKGTEMVSGNDWVDLYYDVGMADAQDELGDLLYCRNNEEVNGDAHTTELLWEEGDRIFVCKGGGGDLHIQ